MRKCYFAKAKIKIKSKWSFPLSISFPCIYILSAQLYLFDFFLILHSCAKVGDSRIFFPYFQVILPPSTIQRTRYVPCTLFNKIHICLQQNRLLLDAKTQQNPMQYMKANSLTSFRYIYNSSYIYSLVHLYMYNLYSTSKFIFCSILSVFCFVFLYNVEWYCRIFVVHHQKVQCERAAWRGTVLLYLTEYEWIHIFNRRIFIQPRRRSEEESKKKKKNESEITLAVCSTNLHFCMMAKLQAFK